MKSAGTIPGRLSFIGNDDDAITYVAVGRLSEGHCFVLGIFGEQLNIPESWLKRWGDKGWDPE